jgi:hypothetical protein
VGLFGRRQTDAGLGWAAGGSARSLVRGIVAGQQRAATSKQASKQQQRRRQRATRALPDRLTGTLSRQSRAQTAQPEDLGRDAGGGGADVRGWWMGDGVQHKNPLGCVGYRQSAWAGLGAK